MSLSIVKDLHTLDSILLRHLRLLYPIKTTARILFYENFANGIGAWQNDSEGDSDIYADNSVGNALGGAGVVKCLITDTSYAKGGCYLQINAPMRKLGFGCAFRMGGTLYADYNDIAFGMEYFDGSTRHYPFVVYAPPANSGNFHPWNIATKFAERRVYMNRWAPCYFIANLDTKKFEKFYMGHELLASNVDYYTAVSALSKQLWIEFEANSYAGKVDIPLYYSEIVVTLEG